MQNPSEATLNRKDLMRRGLIETDKNEIPTQVTDRKLLYHLKTDIENSFPYLIKQRLGKWMLFFDHEEFDKKWKDYCDLYDEGKLIGIRRLTCSTGFKSSRTTEHTSGVIMFFCGPASERSKILEYGRNLLNQIPYYNRYGHIAYKTEEQSDRGTRATGNRDNSLYRLPVLKREISEVVS